ncbi:FadR family transcriptional regulator [Vibrio sp. AK197]
MIEYSSLKQSGCKLHVQIATEIACKILSGELTPNEKLPSEMELCSTFGVSRTALRESSKLLSAKGLIAAKPKIGTIVLPRHHWHFLDPQLLEWIKGLNDNQRFLAQFLGLRKAIEPEACALAAKHATVEHRKELSVIFQQMVLAAEQFNYDEWIKNDHLFHQTIFLATQNHFFLPFSNILSTIFKLFINHSSEGGRFCLDEHRVIYDAIMAGNSIQARLASQALLQDDNQKLSRLGVV